MSGGDEQLNDPGPLSPAAGIDEIREHIQRTDAWRRVREPVADGGEWAKFITKYDLYRYGFINANGELLLTGGTTTTPTTTDNYIHAFEPRTEIVLPVDQSNNVTTYIDAWTNYVVRKNDAPDTVNWTVTKTDENCTSTLDSSKRITITGFGTLGSVTSVSTVSLTATATAAGYATFFAGAYDGTSWWLMQSPSGSPATVTNLVKTTDWNTFTVVPTGVAAGNWQTPAAGNGTLCVVEGTNVSNRVLHSTDGGATFTIQTMPTAISKTTMVYGDRFFVTENGGTRAYTSTSGLTGSWTLRTMPASSLKPVWGRSGSTWLAHDSGFNAYLTTDAGANWTTNVLAGALPVGQTVRQIYRFRDKWIAFLNGGTTVLVSSSGAVGTWVKYTTPVDYGVIKQGLAVSGILYVIDPSGRLIYTSDGSSWKWNGTTPLSSGSWLNNPLEQVVGEYASTFIPVMTGGGTAGRINLSATSDTDARVITTATKSGATTVVKVLTVRKGTPAGDVYSFGAVPGAILLPATSDGVVTSYASGSTTAIVAKNGNDDTVNWTVTWVASAGITPASGSGQTATITAMAQGTNTGTITFTATKSGQAVVTGSVGVTKALGQDTSGIQIGAAVMSWVAIGATFIGVKLTRDGRVMVRRGAGSYQTAFSWMWPNATTVGDGWWVRVTLMSGPSLTTGTVGSYVQLNVDREWTLEQTTTGTYESILQFDMNTSATDIGAWTSAGGLKLIVP